MNGGKGGCAGQGNQAEPWMGPGRTHFPAPTFMARDWYHVAMQVKGSGPADCAVWVDGFPTDATAVRYRPGGKLSTPLSIPASDNDYNDQDVYVDDTSDFPPNGAALVDGEVIEYKSRGRGALQQASRAKRMTHALPHEADSLVTPYGYRVELRSILHTGRGEITSVVGEVGEGPNPQTGPETTLQLKMKDPVEGTHELLPSGSSEIPVVSTIGFQQSGYAMIKGKTRDPGDYTPGTKNDQDRTEYVYFSGSKGDALTGCTWTQFRDTPLTRDFKLDGLTKVRQISIAFTGRAMLQFRPESRQWGAVGRSDGDHYAALYSPESPQVEWISVQWMGQAPDASHGDVYYLVGMNASGTVHGVRQSWAGWRGFSPGELRDRGGNPPVTYLRPLPVGTVILPVFRVNGPQLGDWDSPRGYERVTLVNGSQAEAQPRLVRYALIDDEVHNDNTTCSFTFRASLDDAPSREYAPGSHILKFPSGEMPRITPPSMSVGSAPNAGGFSGTLDETRIQTLGRESDAVAHSDQGQPVQPNDGSIPIMRVIAMDGGDTPSTGAPAGSPAQGVVRIDSEYIFYGSTASASRAGIAWGKEQRTDQKLSLQYNARHVGTTALSDCVRGVLGSQRARHYPGARVVFVEGLPLTQLQSISNDAMTVASATGFPVEGYAAVSPFARPCVGEIVGWTGRRGNALTGVDDFRARYGTGLGASGLALSLPFRYWSREALAKDVSGLAYFQAAHSSRGATWRSVEWQERGFDGGAVTERIRLRALVRFDGGPDWTERPAGRAGGLWEFIGAGEHSFGRGIVADSIEIRVFWDFLPGAWADGVNDWKRTLRLTSLAVKYGNPLVVRKVDLLEY